MLLLAWLAEVGLPVKQRALAVGIPQANTIGENKVVGLLIQDPDDRLLTLSNRAYCIGEHLDIGAYGNARACALTSLRVDVPGRSVWRAWVGAGQDAVAVRARCR